jgi:VWFA-related protein
MAVPRRNFVLLLWLLLACLATSSAQDQTADKPNEQVVKLSVTIVDRKGNLVENAKKEDFQLLDNGVPVGISSFVKESVPVTYGLVIDGSGSLKNQFRDILNAAAAIIDSHQDTDEAFIVKFVSSDNIRTIQDLTSDKLVLSRALSNVKTEGGQTALIDGVYVAAQYADAHRRANQRPVLVLISDGEDRISYYNESTLFKLLAKTNVQVFILGMIGQLENDSGLVRLSSRQKATDLLKKLAHETGGRAFIASSRDEIATGINQLTQNLHNQYIITYTPANDPRNPNRKVQLKPLASTEHEKWTVINPQVVGAKK